MQEMNPKENGMLFISYGQMVAFISIVWLLVRFCVYKKTQRFSWKRELQLMLVYICIVVVVRFTFCPFGKVDGKIQPLVFDPAQVYPFKTNLEPLIHLFDYPTLREALVNLIGNTAMFIPLGIVWPAVFPQLNTHGKRIAAGFGCSLVIEILQLPFFERYTDLDDLILNTVGFLLGYGIWLLVKKLKK